MDYRKELLKDFLQWFVKGAVELKHHGEIIDEYLAESDSIPIEPPVKPEIADTTKITMWVDMIWNDIFDDDELPLTAAQMNIIGKYINDAKEKIRKQFSV